MSKFVIDAHFRLQEWVAEEKGFFADEGLDYDFREHVRTTDGAIHDTGDKVGAYQSLEAGRNATVSCACHWTVNVAASTGNNKIFADAYSVAPSGIFVAPDAGITTPEELAGVPISVGYQSGSHYSTIQALERCMEVSAINLSFEDGMLFARMEKLLNGETPAAALFNGPYYMAEQLGFRKIMDTTFMISANIAPDVDREDLRKYYAALKRAQAEIDARPEQYTHYYKNEFPLRFHAQMDTRRWGPGERIVFEAYDKTMYDLTFEWIAEHKIFERGDMGHGDYDKAALSLS